MNACGEMGTAGDSDGGGAGVRRRARISENRFLCGDGRVIEVVGEGVVGLVSQASRREMRPLEALAPEGSEEGG